MPGSVSGSDDKDEGGFERLGVREVKDGTRSPE